jgi:hypothetical protein
MHAMFVPPAHLQQLKHEGLLLQAVHQSNAEAVLGGAKNRAPDIREAANSNLPSFFIYGLLVV